MGGRVVLVQVSLVGFFFFSFLQCFIVKYYHLNSLNVPAKTRTRNP